MADRGLGLRFRDELGVGHRGEHGLGALLGALGIAVRRQPRRRFDQARQHGGLGQCHVPGGFAEIALRGRLDAIGAGAEIDPVEIEFEDLGLGMLALQPERELGLLQLALQRALLGQKQVLGKLLRQRRAALRDAAMQDVGHRRAQDAERIDAVMRIEPAVLDGDEGFRQIGRQILQRDIGAGHFAARRQHAAVEADDLDGRRPFWNFQRLDRRQVRAGPDHDADDRDRRPQAKHRAPVEQPGDAAAAARFGAATAAAFGSCAASTRAAVVIIVVAGLAPGRGFLRLVIGGRDAVLRPEPQFRKRCAEPELWLPACPAFFPSPRHTQLCSRRPMRKTSGRGLKPS